MKRNEKAKKSNEKEMTINQKEWKGMKNDETVMKINEK